MWSSAAVDHLLQGSTCCAFRDGILHTLVVTRAATNDYFDNQLVGRLFFRLIGLHNIILLTKNKNKIN